MRALAGASILVVALLAACRTRDTETGAGSGSGSATQMPRVRRYEPQRVEMTAPPIDLPKQELFEVVEPGKGPKQKLVYNFARGEVEHRTETRLETRQLGPGGKFGAATKLPAIRDGFALIVVSGAAEPLQLRALVAEIDGKPTPLAEQYVATWRGKLQNRRIEVAIDTRGQLGKVTFKDDPDNQRSTAAKDEIVQRLLAMTVPVPDVAVGIGAKWRVRTVLRHGAAYVNQTAEYTLVERKPARWKLRVKILRVGEEQSVVDPALPRGATADLLAMFRLFEGDVEIDPKLPLVAAGSYKLESRVHAKLKLPGKLPVEQFVEDLGTITFRSSVTKPAAVSP